MHLALSEADCVVTSVVPSYSQLGILTLQIVAFMFCNGKYYILDVHNNSDKCLFLVPSACE